MGLQDELKILGDSVKQTAKDWDEGRQKWIDTSSQKVDDVVTGGLESLNVPGAEFIGDRARNVTGFAQDVVLPESWELPIIAGAAAMPVDGPLGEAAIYGTGVINRSRRLAKAAKKATLANMANIVDDAFSKANSLFSRATNPNWRLATEGSSIDTSMLMSKKDDLSQRMGDAYDSNKQIIKNKGSLDGNTGIREIDKLARVNKTKIRKYVEEFGGNEDDVTRIFNEHVLKQKNIKQSRTWLNQYFKKLTSGLGPDGLKNVKIMEVNGVETLVDGSTNKAIGHAFEVDHSKAKELMASLGLEGADFHENLDIVYTVWNRDKNNIGNPAIYDDVLRATGQSTSLRELVQRSLDKTFDAKFTRVPERFRDLARRQILEDIQAGVTIKGKPSKMREQIIERHLKFWDDNADIITQMDDYVPEELLNDPDFWADPQQTYESLLNMGVLDSLKPAYKKRVKRMTDQWVKLNRGSTAVRDYLEKTGGNTIKKKYN